MRRFPWGWFIFVLAVAAIVIDYRLNFAHEVEKMTAVQNLQRCPSRIYLQLTIRYATPPIYEEEYKMQDIEGLSTAVYRIQGYDGKQITITAPAHQEYDVSFLFGKLDHQDGIWDITNKPPVGNTNAQYTIYVKQYVDCKEGQRTVTFTDPHYWAVTAGHQYEINLASAAPKNAEDLLRLKGTTVADPRYETVVNDFRTFGSNAFRAKVAEVRRSITRGT